MLKCWAIGDTAYLKGILCGDLNSPGKEEIPLSVILFFSCALMRFCRFNLRCRMVQRFSRLRVMSPCQEFQKPPLKALHQCCKVSNYMALQILLLTAKGQTCFLDLKTVNGYLCHLFRLNTPTHIQISADSYRYIQMLPTYSYRYLLLRMATCFITIQHEIISYSKQNHNHQTIPFTCSIIVKNIDWHIHEMTRTQVKYKVLG